MESPWGNKVLTVPFIWVSLVHLSRVAWKHLLAIYIHCFWSSRLWLKMTLISASPYKILLLWQATETSKATGWVRVYLRRRGIKPSKTTEDVDNEDLFYNRNKRYQFPFPPLNILLGSRPMRQSYFILDPLKLLFRPLNFENCKKSKMRATI